MLKLYRFQQCREKHFLTKYRYNGHILCLAGPIVSKIKSRPPVNDYISTSSGQNALKFLGAVGYIVLQDILQFQSDN